ncbi:MAG: FecR domain-containing protein [Leptospirales bacterium]|nr:FecR domain-containing protein [Leptospirales bacterium]
MKKISVLFLFLFALIPFTVKGAHVVFYMGQIEAVRNAKKLPISNGAMLQSGDIITTGPKSILNIAYDDGSRVEILENTSIMIGADGVKNSSSVVLIFGSVKGKFAKLGKDKKVYTSTTICAIRGTEFQISAGRDGSSRIDLQEGALAISNNYGFEDMKQGEKLEVELSKAPFKTKRNISAEEWMNEKESELASDPEKKTDQFRVYIDDLSKDSKEKTKLVRSLPRMPDEETEAQLAKTEDDAIDNLFISQALSLSLENLANDFKDYENKDVHKNFRRLKKEADALHKLRRKIYGDVQEVRLRHQEARKSILDKHNESKMKIKGNIR